jgi:hypothetical protein
VLSVDGTPVQTVERLRISDYALQRAQQTMREIN